jgi:hypothetical protein
VTEPIPTSLDLDRPVLDAHVLAVRLRESGRETQILLNSVLMSVAVANAAFVLARLLASGISAEIWLPFVLAGLGLLIVSFTGMSMSSLLAVYIPDLRDSILPLVQAMAVFLLFSVLTPDGAAIPLLGDWFAIVGVHALIGAMLIWNLTVKLRGTKYHADLEAGIRDLIRSRRSSMAVAIAVGMLWIGVWIGLRALRAAGHPALPWIPPLLAIGVLIQSILVLRAAQTGRDRIVGLVRGNPDGRDEMRPVAARID